MFALRWMPIRATRAIMHNQCAEELRRRFFATRSPGSLSRLTSASNALCPGCGRRCDRARQGPASSPAPAYIGAQRGGFPSALPVRRRPEGFCVPTPRSGRTEERPRVSTAASHSIEGGRGPQHARRQPAASSGRPQLRAGARDGFPASSGQMRPGIRSLKCLPPKGKRLT